MVNAFTPDDSEYGLGEPAGRDAFIYNGTLFRFFRRQLLLELFRAWDVERCDEQRWVDPPHGSFRPYEHTHSNWVLIARAPG